MNKNLISSFLNFMKKTINIAVWSQSNEKITPVQKAFSTHFLNQNCMVLWYKTTSDINEQPVWYEETRLWAYNRLEKLKKITQSDYYVSIENGITHIDQKRFDFGHIIIEDAKGKIIETLTQSVEFPEKAVMLAMKKGFTTTTVGSVLHELDPTISATDPHYTLTNETYSRKDLLYNALIWWLWQLSDVNDKLNST